MPVKFAPHLNQEEQQIAHDALCAAIENMRNAHWMLKIRHPEQALEFAKKLLQITELIEGGMSEEKAIDLWRGPMRKAMEWGTNIDVSKEVSIWDTHLAASKDVLSRAAGKPLDNKYARPLSEGGLDAVHEHIIVNMAIFHNRSAFVDGTRELSEVARRVQIFLRKRATVFITKDEESTFNKILLNPAKPASKKNPVVRKNLKQEMSDGYDPFTSSPFDRYIAAGYDLTKLVINPMWL